jgi:hypothetical protein
MNVTVQDAITILSISATIVIGIRSFLWSKDYKDAKQAQLDAKDDQIKLLERESSIYVNEAFESMKNLLEIRIDQLKIVVRELQNANEMLHQQLGEAKSTNSAFVSNFPQVNLDTQQKQILTQFVTASGEDLDNISGTADVYSVLEQKFISTADEISKDTIYKIWSPSENKFIWPEAADTMESIFKYDDEQEEKKAESNDPESEFPNGGN